MTTRMKFCLRIQLILLSSLVLLGCSDYYHRTYSYDQTVPVKPFSMKISKVDYGNKDGKLILKVHLHIKNETPKTEAISTSRFRLRIGKTHEVDSNLPENSALNSTSFNVGEDGEVVIPFTLPQEAWSERLVLIVDRQRKKEKELLTLVEVKNCSTPKKLADGEWRTVQSSCWD
jgi:hypothetical protein